jgi:anti-anti-sigma factor
MNVKIDTKEKLQVISPQDAVLSADMTAQLSELLQSLQNNKPNNLVFNCAAVKEMSVPVAETIMNAQQQYYEKNISFVVCELKPAIEELLDQNGFLELMNITPTESEACDIVQMEEIEREFMDSHE